jgi:hypothetical protein
MIFGFNTDIRHEDTVYHVQSEARTGEQLLQTQVFVKGRCIGKRAVSYGASGSGGNMGIPNVVSNNDQDREKMLRDLHREVLDAIRDGKLDSILDKRESAAVKELDLEWVNAGSVHSSGALTMQIRVTDGGATVEGARLTLRFARPDAVPFYTQVITDAKGNAEMKVHVDDTALAESSVLVQASFAGKTATRKFQLRAAV